MGRSRVKLRPSRLGAVLCGVVVLGCSVVSGAAAAFGTQHSSQSQAPSCSSTTTISPGEMPTSGSITDPSSPQCFTFDDVGGDTVFADAVATSTNPTPTVSVIDPEGDPLSERSASLYPTDAPGSYTIAVSDSSAGPFNLGFQLSSDPVGCTSVSFGEPAIDTAISSPGENLCFQVSVPSTEWLYLHASKPTSKVLAFGEFGPDGFFRAGGAGKAIGSDVDSDFGVQTLLVFASQQSPVTGPLVLTIGDLEVSPLAAPAASDISSFGSGFTPGESFKVTYATGLAAPTHVVVCKGIVRPSGQAHCSGAIPSAAGAGAPGPHVITMTGQSSKHTGEVSFELR